MQVNFKNDYLRLLFCDKYFQGDLGVRATQSYRFAVQYTLSAHSLNDLHAAAFLNLSNQSPYSVKIDQKHRLAIEIDAEEQIHLIDIIKVES